MDRSERDEGHTGDRHADDPRLDAPHSDRAGKGERSDRGAGERGPGRASDPLLRSLARLRPTAKHRDACSYCDEGLDGEQARAVTTCPTCKTRVHTVCCAERQGACPIRGCVGRPLAHPADDALGHSRIDWLYTFLGCWGLAAYVFGAAHYIGATPGGSLLGASIHGAFGALFAGAVALVGAWLLAWWFQSYE